MVKLNADMKAGTDAATVTDVQVNHVSQTIAKPHVVGSAIGYEDKLQIVAASVSAEVLRAKTMFPNNFVNQHEAYAVILEEVDELWDEIKKNQRNYDLDAQRKEAVQAAAMLFRLLVELL